MKSKQFMAGVIVGSVITSSIAVFASGQIVSAIKTDDTTIYVDGEKLELEDGYEILNYEDRVYTSTRSVAQALGGEVKYIADFDGKNIYLTSPEPEVIEVPIVVDPIPQEPDGPDEIETEVDYRLPPAKATALGVTVMVTRAENPYDELEVEVNVENSNSEGSSYFNYGKFKIIDEDGEVYSVKRESSSDNTNFYSAIPNNGGEFDEVMRFNNIPAGTNCTLIMPLSRMGVNGKIEDKTIEIPLIIEDYDTTTK